jgi:paraquat-inducible protein B
LKIRRKPSSDKMIDQKEHFILFSKMILLLSLLKTNLIKYILTSDQSIKIINHGISVSKTKLLTGNDSIKLNNIFPLHNLPDHFLKIEN